MSEPAAPLPSSSSAEQQQHARRQPGSGSGSGDEKQENKQQEPPELSPEAAELEEKLARFYQMMNPERLKNESGRAKLRTVAARYAGDEKRLNGEWMSGRQR